MPNTTPHYTKEIDVLVQSSTRNRKTGNVPTIIVGQDIHEIKKSCLDSGCPLLSEKMGGSGEYKKHGLKPCYAHASSVSWATKSILKAIDKGSKTIKDYSIKEGFRMSSRHAKFFRLSSIGDCSSLSRKVIDKLVKTGKEYNLKPLGYTAGWRQRPDLKDIVLASNITMKDADEAVSQGWRATCQVPKGTKKRFLTPAGNEGIVCPEQTQKSTTPRNKITCNTCGLCSEGNQHKTRFKVIGFINH